MENEELLRRIQVRAGTLGGKPVIRDTRISVELILGLLAAGETIESLLDGYPGLEPDDIRACFAYAYAIVANETIEVVRA